MKFEPTNFAEALAAEYLEILKQNKADRDLNSSFIDALDSLENEDLYDLMPEISSVEEEIAYPEGTRKVLGGGMMCVVEDGGFYVVLSYAGDNSWQPCPWLSPEAVEVLKSLPTLRSDDY